MAKGVIAYLMMSGKDSIHQPWVGFGVFANDKECCRHILLLQDAENRGCITRIGSIIESKRDDFVGIEAPAVNDETSRRHQYLVVREKSDVSIETYTAATLRRRALHSQNFPLAFVVDVVFEAHRFERLSHAPVQLRGMTQHGPNTWVFRTQTP